MNDGIINSGNNGFELKCCNTAEGNRESKPPKRQGFSCTHFHVTDVPNSGIARRGR